jgi:hypothetical protein
MSEWLIQESLKRDKIISTLRLWVAFLAVTLMVVSVTLLYYRLGLACYS